MMNVNMHLRVIECCGVNCEELLRDIISEVPGCIVMVIMLGFYNSKLYKLQLMQLVLGFLRQKMHGYSLSTGICLFYVIHTVH